MRHRKRTAKLGVKTDHRKAMLRNLTLGLLEHGRIKTTVARAKRLRMFVEPLVTKLKNPSVANIRLANSTLANRAATLKIAQEISPKFSTRPGGYTRILKLANPRVGDNASLALIEWSDESLVPAYSEMVSPRGKGEKKSTAKKAAPAKDAKKSGAAKKKTSKKAETESSEG
jgi:large subunit ribosomal protein L17